MMTIAMITRITININGKRGFSRYSCASFIRRFANQADPNVAVVKTLQDPDDMIISVEYSGVKQTTTRKQDEKIQRCLQRLRNSLQDKLRKAKKLSPSGSRTGKGVQLCLVDSNDQQVDDNRRNIDVWNSHHRLYINHTPYHIILNPPQIVTMLLPPLLMTHNTIYPQIQLECCQIEQCQFTWYRSHANASHDPTCCQWIEIGHEYCYQPTSKDIDCYLKVRCKLPLQSVNEAVAISDRPVITGPQCQHLQQRFNSTTAMTAKKEIRTVSYNILGESYAGSKYAKQLYRYCPDDVLDMNYRQQLLVTELVNYNADLICLQEVSQQTFDRRLSYGLHFNGFQGLWRHRAFDNRDDGLAIFYNQSKFQLISQHNLDLNASIQKDSYQKSLFNLIRRQHQLLQNVLTRSNVLQVAIFKWKGFDNRLICLANTHLYFRPTAELVRLVQIQAIINHLSFISANNQGLPIILCGDFNSQPSSNAYQLVTTGNSQYTVDDETLNSSSNKQTINLEFSHQLTFDVLSGILNSTHYTPKFSGTIDYIFGRRGYFEVKNVIPPPQLDDINSKYGLPTSAFPSDHFAIICDICMT